MVYYIFKFNVTYETPCSTVLPLIIAIRCLLLYTPNPAHQVFGMTSEVILSMSIVSTAQLKLV